MYVNEIFGCLDKHGSVYKFISNSKVIQTTIDAIIIIIIITIIIIIIIIIIIMQWPMP